MRSFLQLHAAFIARLARFEARPPADPNDVAQEVVASLLKQHAAAKFDPAKLENPEAYLRVVVRNSARAARARAAREHAEGDDRLDEVPASGRTPEDVTRDAIDTRKLLERVKERLRPRDAVAFALLVEDGLDIEDVAKAMGTTTNNVYQMRHRILAVAREVQSSSIDLGGAA